MRLIRPQLIRPHYPLEHAAVRMSWLPSQPWRHIWTGKVAGKTYHFDVALNEERAEPEWELAAQMAFDRVVREQAMFAVNTP